MKYPQDDDPPKQAQEIIEQLEMQGYSFDFYNMVNQMKLEAFLKGMNDKSVEQIENFFK